MKLIVWSLWFLLCIYNGLDVYQTKLLFDLGVVEVNPIMLWLISQTGKPILSMVVFKVIWLSLFAIAIVWTQKNEREAHMDSLSRNKIREYSCNRCGEKMSKVWQVYCSQCHGYSCYNHAVVRNGLWWCSYCDEKNNIFRRIVNSIRRTFYV
jgi:hypothetical protein